MPASALAIVLWSVAIVTLFAGLVGLLPRTMVLRQLPLGSMDEAGWLFFRHWAVLVIVCGVLLIWAAVDPSLRPPVLLLVAAEKLGFAVIVFNHRQTPLGRAFRAGAVADSAAALVLLACVVA